MVTGTFSHTYQCTRTLFNNSLKNLQKNSSICKPSTHNVVSTGHMAFLVLYGLCKVHMVLWKNVNCLPSLSFSNFNPRLFFYIISFYKVNNIISYSAGVGRTGCFIAASIGIEQIKVCFQGFYLRKFLRSPTSKLEPKPFFLGAQDNFCCCHSGGLERLGKTGDRGWGGVNCGNFGKRTRGRGFP